MTETLYPFLHPARPADPDGVLAEVRRSTEEKAREIAALRESLAAVHGERLVACARRMAEAFRAGGRLLAFGNGGSGTDAQALAALFVRPPAPARPLPATSLPQDVAALTALSNDVGFEVVFARQIAALGRAGDIAVGLSTSGGSANVVAAFAEAARRGLVTVGFAGYDGGAMGAAGTVGHLFVVPSPSVHRIQEAQTTLYHVLWELTQHALDGGL
ncbi:D-sedoheptulose-7-phosphate isomerase [Thermomonospora amylolytica]|uniref:D-sedoheptulose-7-phosphate isomerase n=1 Tax=Thermomonospora amylolytica TaxID=1411117 RepID=UPI000E6C855E|nr:SIS domain-containing protein [Thermomonospora amylolytica]